MQENTNEAMQPFFGTEQPAANAAADSAFGRGLEQILARDGRTLRDDLDPKGKLALQVALRLDQIATGEGDSGGGLDRRGSSSRTGRSGKLLSLPLAKQVLGLLTAALVLLVFLPAWLGKTKAGQEQPVEVAQHTALTVISASRLESMHPIHLLRSLGEPLSELVLAQGDEVEQDVRRALVGLTERLPGFLR